ncbi:MAG: terminase family protein [Capsulimonas sp.]|uniref:terminase large subunit domain-containing protein n=1 Tax=Capsulimonas sp. TaxID=2494211 RepID=UPI003267426A
MAKATDRRSIELAKCAADVAYFTHFFCVIDDAQDHGDGGGTMPFHLWPAQVKVLWLFLVARLILILKARQLGISWLCCAYALWLCLFHPGKLVLIFSKGQLEANEMLRRISVLYERLPEWMLAALPQRVKDNTEVQAWANGSSVMSLSKAGGRSFTASLAILDEAAHIQGSRELYMALKPTIDAGGRLIILSTANGLGNLFHLLWTRAVAGKNTFKTIFLPWWARPARDRAWYEAQRAEATDPDQVKQEYPSTANEAFVASGRVRFAGDWINAQTDFIEDPIPVADLPDSLRGIDSIQVYRLPVAGRKYVIGADVAEGLEHGDFSTAVLIDQETWEECATIHGHWEPDEYAGLLMALAAPYGARIAVERNNHGHAVLVTLKMRDAKNVVDGHDGRPGWLTNAQTKPMSIDLLAQALRDVICKVRSAAALDEMQIYRRLDNGGTGAPESYYDDRVIAWAIALIVARNPGGWAQDPELMDWLKNR